MTEVPESTPRRDPALLALLAAGLLLRLLIAWAPFSYLASRGPIVDDTFYSLSVARNIARGAGVTADGIHPTSGFQPLYTFLLVPFYLVSGDPVLPIHLALTLLALAGALTGWFLFRIVSPIAGRQAALFSLFLWTFAPYFLSHGLNGLETGLFGLALAATLDYYLRSVRPEPAPRRLALLGLLLGLTILVRVDGVLFAGAVGIDLLLRRGPLLRRLGRALLPAGTALATLSPYLVFLYARFGVILPESGPALRFLSLCYGTLFVLGPRSAFLFPPEQVPWIYYAGSLRKAVQVLLQEPLLFPSSLVLAVASAAKVFSPRAILLVMAGGAALAANLLFLRRPRGSPDDAWRGLARVGLLCAAFWIPAYAFGVLGQWWFQRYFFPLFLLMTLASGLMADRIARSRVIGKWMRPAGFVAAAACLHLLLFAWQTPEEFFRTKPYRNVSSYMQAARVLDETLPAGSLGGAFQSGTIGYFARHPVINLDGVVNRDAARALKEKRMADYIREEGIEAIIDWPLWIEALLVRRSPAGAASLGPTRQAGIFLLMRVEPSPGRSGEEPQR